MQFICAVFNKYAHKKAYKAQNKATTDIEDNDEKDINIMQ
jgi:hypothetical protein